MYALGTGAPAEVRQGQEVLMELVKCPYCRGEGFLSLRGGKGTLECTKCEGTGAIKASWPADRLAEAKAALNKEK